MIRAMWSGMCAERGLLIIFGKLHDPKWFAVVYLAASLALWMWGFKANERRMGA